MDTTIAQGIRSVQEAAAYDAACKRLLAEKIILAWIMKRCVAEYRDVSVTDITEKYIEGTPQIGEAAVLPDNACAPRITGIGESDTSLYEGNVFYDIRFHAVAPGSGELLRLIINVEAQNDFYPGYPLIRRAIYYCSRMISAQHGTEFTKSHYEKIKKVYSIWICSNPPQSRANTIMQYSFAETALVGQSQERVEDYDLMTAVMICLGDSQDKQPDALLRLLDVLFSAERDPEEKCRILKEDFCIPMNDKMEGEVSDMCNLSKGVYDRGIEQGKLDDLKALIEATRWSVAQAMEILKVPQADRERYAALLAQRGIA